MVERRLMFWNDHLGAGLNAIRARTLIEKADVVVDRAALAVAREPEQVVDILRYAVAGLSH